MKILLLAALILIHEWYPRECCNGSDCKPVPCEEITAGDCNEVGPCRHWHGMEFRNVLESQDGQCHVCARDPVKPGEAPGMFWSPGAPYCIFIPKQVVS